MREGAEPHALGIRAFAAVLVVIGLASVLTNGAAVALSRDVSMIQTAIAIGYGIAAVAAGTLAWRGMPGARRAYLAWCATIVLYLWTMPKLFVWYSVPALFVAVLLVGWGYRYISRNVESETVLGRRRE